MLTGDHRRSGRVIILIILSFNLEGRRKGITPPATILSEARMPCRMTAQGCTARP
jgi:hypothetical protein